MKAWRRSGGLGAAVGVAAPFDFLIANGAVDTLDTQWSYPGADPDTFNTEIRYDGGPWNPSATGIPGTERTGNEDVAGHSGELAQCRIQAVTGGQQSSWAESNSVLIPV